MDIIMTASGCNTAMGRNLIKDAIYRNYKGRDIRQMTAYRALLLSMLTQLKCYSRAGGYSSISYRPSGIE